ncbi:M23 family peptidase, partial [Winogradskyella sp.]|nr:M23 family peptidase [Winogradskyella sp.]
MQLKRLVAVAIIAICIYSCKEDDTAEQDYNKALAEAVEEEKIIEFGFDLKKHIVKRDTIKKGDTFGE